MAYKGKKDDFKFEKDSNKYDYAFNEDTGKYQYTEKGVARRNEYNRNNYASISFSMKPEDYELYMKSAEKAGMKFATWVRTACNSKIEEL